MPVIWDLDTRALVRHLRKVGALRGVISTDGTDAGTIDCGSRALPTMAGQELAGRVTCDEAIRLESRVDRLRLAVESRQ